MPVPTGTLTVPLPLGVQPEPSQPPLTTALRNPDDSVARLAVKVHAEPWFTTVRRPAPWSR
jgi:hypothetical protein